MKTSELIKNLQSRPVFSVSDVERITGKSRQYAYLIIQRLKDQKQIFQIENGKYTCQTDPIIIASRIVWPSYVSGWAALQFYGMTEQLPNVIEVMTTRSRKRRKLELVNASLEFSRMNPSRFFGYRKIDYKKTQIFIAQKEKALLDCLFFGHISPDEFLEILRNNKKKLNQRVIRSYAKKMSKQFLLKVVKLVSR